MDSYNSITLCPMNYNNRDDNLQKSEIEEIAEFASFQHSKNACTYTQLRSTVSTTKMQLTGSSCLCTVLSGQLGKKVCLYFEHDALTIFGMGGGLGSSLIKGFLL